MATSVSFMHCSLALALIYVFVSACQLGRAQNTQTAAAGVLANEYFPGSGSSTTNQGQPATNIPGAGGSTTQDHPETGTIDADPDYIVAKALLCFNEKQIYSSCNEAYRLTNSGDLHVPPEHTDEYCNGPCLSETHLVLNCIESLMSQFKFYNEATIGDVKETINAGCSFGPKRGDFNVAEHIQAENSNAPKTSSLFLHGLLLVVLGYHILL